MNDNIYITDCVHGNNRILTTTGIKTVANLKIDDTVYNLCKDKTVKILYKQKTNTKIKAYLLFVDECEYPQIILSNDKVKNLFLWKPKQINNRIDTVKFGDPIFTADENMFILGTSTECIISTIPYLTPCFNKLLTESIKPIITVNPIDEKFEIRGNFNDIEIKDIEDMRDNFNDIEIKDIEDMRDNFNDIEIKYIEDMRDNFNDIVIVIEEPKSINKLISNIYEKDNNIPNNTWIILENKEQNFDTVVKNGEMINLSKVNGFVYDSETVVTYCIHCDYLNNCKINEFKKTKIKFCGNINCLRDMYIWNCQQCDKKIDLENVICNDCNLPRKYYLELDGRCMESHDYVRVLINN